MGRVPARQLRLDIRDAPRALWVETPHRQQRFEVHRATRSIMLLWAEHQDFPEVQVHVGPRWDDFAPGLVPVIDAAVSKVAALRGDGRRLRVCNAVLARLPPGARIPPHADTARFFGAAHRLHVPLYTNPAVEFRVDGAPVPMPTSHLIEINNRLVHEVLNRSSEDRDHLIVDLLPEGAGDGVEGDR